MPRTYDDKAIHLSPYLIPMLKRIGKTFDKCEQCGADLNGKFDLHHTKYEGATIYDIQVVCRKCNMQTKNKNLK